MNPFASLRTPANRPAELAAVSLLSQIESVATTYRWTSDLFLSEDTRILADHILECRRLGQRADLPTLHASLTASGKIDRVGGASGIEDVLATYPISPRAKPDVAGYFFAQLSDSLARRRVLAVIANHAPSVADGSVDLAEFSDAVQQATRPPEARNTQSWHSHLREFVAVLEGRTKIETFPTGLTGLDIALQGGLARGEMLTVCAQTGGGKSLLLTMAALECALAGKKVAFFSLEMPGQSIAARIAANLANTPVPRPDLPPNPHTINRLEPAIRRMAELPIDVRDDIHTITDLETEIRMLAKLGRADVVFVDYIQRIQNPGHNTREQTVSDTTSRLKTLALTTKCGLFTASQLNRDGLTRESDAIAHDSDIVLVIGEKGISCRKFRRGPSEWLIPVEMNGALGRFDEKDRP